MEWPEFYSPINIRMGVPIGDVARVSQVLLAQLQQSRTTTEDRTTPGLITSESVNTTAIQSTGNVETENGFFLGDAGLLSNVNVGLQRVTDIENTTTNSITTGGYFTNGINIVDSNITAYDRLTLNSINIPRYMTRIGTIPVFTQLQLDISDDAQTIVYGQYGDTFRVVKIDSFFNVLQDVTISNPITNGVNTDINFGEQVSVSADGLTVACGAIDWDANYPGYFNSGAVFVFRYDGQGWYQLGNIIDRARETPYTQNERIRFSNAFFGNAIKLSGDGNTIVIGARGEDYIQGVVINSNAGAAYVYKYENNAWVRKSELFSDSRVQNDRFGTSVDINKAGDKIAIGSGSGEVYIYHNLSQVHKITNGDGFGDKVAINEDATVMATISYNGHHIYNYDGQDWLEQFFSHPVNYFDVQIHISITDDGKHAIINGTHYLYFEGAWSVFKSGYSQYSKINNDSYRIVDNGTLYFSTPDPTYKLDVAGDANVFEMHALRYYGDGGTLSNIVLEDNLMLTSINYNSANVSGSNTYNLYTTDTITTSYGDNPNLVDINSDGTRVVISSHRRDYLPFVYTYDGSSWNAVQLSSATYTNSPEDIYDVHISSNGNTIAMASGYALYVWRYNGSSWTESKYTQTNGEGTYNSGVSGDGNVILAGNELDSGDTGKVYSFINGTYTGSFVSSISSYNSRFGSRIKLNYDGTRAAITDLQYTGINTGNGRIFLYSRSGTTWTNYKIFYASGTGVNDFSISEDFNTLAYSLNYATQLYINEFINGVWKEDTYPDGPNTLMNCIEVSKSGNVILATKSIDPGGLYVVYKDGDTWITKTISSPKYTAIALASTDNDFLMKVVSYIGAQSNPDFSIEEIRRDATLNIDASNVNITGTLTKASGTFKIDHPLPTMQSTHTLTHSFIEGPKADLIYRGKVRLENGIANVNIDEVSRMTNGTFEALSRDTQCFVTNETDWDIVRGFVNGNILTISSQNTMSNSLISWMVIGERKDKHMYTLDWTDEEGRVVPEKLKI